MDNNEQAVVVLIEYLIVTGIAVTATLVFIFTGAGNSIHLLSSGYTESESASANLALTKLIPATDSLIRSSSDILFVRDNNFQVFISEEENRTVLSLNCNGNERIIEIFNEKPLKISRLAGDDWIRVTNGEAASP